ncbi:MAG TPA: response regulator transcription factor [Candidatus Limnocylindria bacterium]|nr:response regulator transcription factor [Candidatus Limnocylindria bacterium]
MITIVLADDHNLVREGLKHLLKEESLFKLVGEARDGLEAVKLVEKLEPTILLLDLMMPRLHGLEVIRQVRKLNKTKVIVVSMYSDEPYVVEAFRNGATGYVLKDSTGSELVRAIRTVSAGTRFLSPSLSDLAIGAYLNKLDGLPADVYSTLTARERVVLQLAAEGSSTAQIAKQLYISPRTVETHRANVMKKLSLRSQTELVRFAIRRKIIAA